MGGAVGVESVVGKGSTFTLCLPLPRATAGEAARHPAPEAVAPSRGAGLRVLAAEDNPMNRQVLRTLLGQLDIDVVLVEDGAQAVAAAASGVFDLILMDVQMPVMDGPEAVRRIRALETGSGRRTPILALTANAMNHHAQEYSDAGMDGMVSKPIRVPQLLAEMERVLGPVEPAAALVAPAAVA
jgi:CheY-like chemotaxis protein